MKLWLRKIFVILITILTLGMYVPPQMLNAEAADSKEVAPSKDKINHNEFYSIVGGQDTPFYLEDLSSNSLHSIVTLAKLQTISKLGPRIIGQVEDEFNHIILPEMELALTSLIERLGEKDVPYYSISEDPVAGYGEKIFDLYDVRTNRELARFHVRREHRPQEGYWFNFHYHLNSDNFEKHYTIGEIFFDKNTPPKWMS